ncbi:hypothetical protein EKO23_16110 [Nocardioides guangzhouensis]|uniref:Uncharacterized protein n=1 Tax=Nocardioides guangzhouensis TaxID=2497878 RepID=A0A4Q4Z9U6_9ACTN|nr:hypothetical protein [Nocardioides guangzhouensis]RYP84358.1 hypothetical protein EKO23_16110 [Nocardioides guangzhouensis]
MNTHAEYRRHSYRPPEHPRPAEAVEPTAIELARHRDPSLGPEQSAHAQAQKRIAWVRPTELGSYLGPMVGRGIALQTEFVRRARRTPATTTRTLRHHGPDRSAPAVSQEGLGL